MENFDEIITRHKVVGKLLSIYYSDPSLKENIEPVSEFKDLTVYQWDWIDKVGDEFKNHAGNIGFDPMEVKEKFPDCVSNFGSFDIIDYTKLLKELENSYATANT